MATQPPEGLEADEALDPADEVDVEQETQQTDEAPEDDEETVIEIEGDEEAAAEPESAPIRQLRDKLKEKDRELAELRKTAAPKPIEVGPKPEWGDGEAWDWDGDKFAQAQRDWDKQNEAAQRQQADQQQIREKQAQEWQGVHARYSERKAAFQAQAKVAPDAYKASEDAVVSALGNDERGTVVQGMMLKYLDDPAMVTHVLGTRPQKLAAIAAEPDPLKQFLAIYDLSKGIKVVTKRKSPPPPEERLSGSAPLSRGAGDKELERLEKEAARTGDRSKVIAYRASKKAK